MRYFEAKVLVPSFGGLVPHSEEWESALLDRFGGFHAGPEVKGCTPAWGTEPMIPYYVGAEFAGGYAPGTANYELATWLADRVKNIFNESAVYVAVSELAGPFIR